MSLSASMVYLNLFVLCLSLLHKTSVVNGRSSVTDDVNSLSETSKLEQLTITPSVKTVPDGINNTSILDTFSTSTSAEDPSIAEESNAADNSSTVEEFTTTTILQGCGRKCYSVPH
ncbi:uncharacterized protein LOC124355378 [Homalodisca vitripennis]|uniref:uncharacterized protein LOC124355378 n=1 Tax=Homalodisca vitripennis TaxID=197043 RepID=UPI001EE9E6C0|nr:uncharacterized protein LOC124355378 [Homalodisca vitripennis]